MLGIYFYNISGKSYHGSFGHLSWLTGNRNPRVLAFIKPEISRRLFRHQNNDDEIHNNGWTLILTRECAEKAGFVQFSAMTFFVLMTK